jgi:uncharacterized protein with NRDE domain
MCLILFAYQVHPVYPLIVAANRDEFFNRPTAPAHCWEDDPEIIAGRDLEKMGTWMGVTTFGRLSALTNYRNPRESVEGKRSRGELVTGALKTDNLQGFMELLEQNKEAYPGYNLLAGDVNELYYYSNRGDGLHKLAPGIYGMSNHLLNTDWPKVKKGKESLAKIIGSNQENLVEKLFEILFDEERYPDEALPKTGVPLEMERMLSSLFIKSPDYGTRSSTVLCMSDEEIMYIERVFTGDKAEEKRFHFPYGEVEQ